MRMNKLWIAILGSVALLVVAGVFSIDQYIVQHNEVKDIEDAKSKLEHTLIVSAKTGASESQILMLKSLIESQAGVQSVLYVSAEQALVNFKTRHQDDKKILQALEDQGTNPLSATLTVTVADTFIKQSLINIIQSNDKSFVVDRISSW